LEHYDEDTFDEVRMNFIMIGFVVPIECLYRETRIEFLSKRYKHSHKDWNLELWFPFSSNNKKQGSGWKTFLQELESAISSYRKLFILNALEQYDDS